MTNPETALFFAHTVKELTTSSRPEGWLNVSAAWWLIGAGLTMGAILRLWSFHGPIAPPAWLQDYAGEPRRLLRLAHISLIALPVLNLLYVPGIQRSSWSPRHRSVACNTLLLGTLGLPVVLALSAFWPPAVYLSPLPVCCIVGAVLFLAFGLTSHSGRNP